MKNIEYVQMELVESVPQIIHKSGVSINTDFYFADVVAALGEPVHMNGDYEYYFSLDGTMEEALIFWPDMEGQLYIGAMDNPSWSIDNIIRPGMQISEVKKLIEHSSDKVDNVITYSTEYVQVLNGIRNIAVYTCDITHDGTVVTFIELMVIYRTKEQVE